MTTAPDWAGRVGDVWTDEWRRTERTFAELEPALEAAILAVAPDRGGFLDIGCGVGTTTLALAAARATAAVTGADLSAGMIAIAQQRAAQSGAAAVPTFVAGDALAHAARLAPVDLFVSRHGVMFFDDPATAFARLRAAAAPGAALVFSCFRAPAHNPWAGALVAAMTGASPPPPTGYTPGPFAFADPAFVHALLAGAGWQADAPHAVDYAYVAGEGADPVADAASLFQRIGPVAATLAAADAAAKPAMLLRLIEAIARYAHGGRVAFPASAWIWTARATGERA